MNHWPNISAVTVRFLEKANIFDLRVNKDFLSWIQDTVTIFFFKEIDKLGFANIKNFSCERYH